MKLTKEKQTEFTETVKEVAAIAGVQVAGEQPDDPLGDIISAHNETFDHTLYTKHQLTVISYVAEKLPQRLAKVLDLYPDHYDHTTMLAYAESLDRDDLKTLSLTTLSRLKRYLKDYQASLYLYTVGGGTHSVYNVDTQLLTKEDPAFILDIPVLDNQPLSADNYISVITKMRDIVYKRYYKYIEDNRGLWKHDNHNH